MNIKKRWLGAAIAVVLAISSFAVATNTMNINAFSDEEEELVSDAVVQNDEMETEETSTIEDTIVDETNEVVEATEETNEEVVNAEIQPAIPKVVGAFSAMTPASTDVDSLKAQIESATSDITITLEAGVYAFDTEIKNTKAIKVTIIGAVDENGQPATKFTMNSSTTGVRFVRVDAGTLDIRNISVTGTQGVNGGISAKNAIATNCSFSKNYTTDGVAGGGAIHSNGGNITIEKSTFTQNSCATTSDGGAVAVQYGGSVYINESSFDGNTRIGNNNQYGGALSIKQPSVANSTIVIQNSSFTNNQVDASGSWTRGGAIHIYSTPQVASVLIDNVLFKGNSATYSLTNNGGAVAFMTMTTKSTISNCTFINNKAAKYGGAVYYENSLGDNKIINSTFVGNTASLGGASVGAYSSSTTLDSSTFISNAFATQGTGSLITVTNSIVAGTNTYASATIAYTGVNLARTSSAEPSVSAASVFTAYTSDTLVKVADYNYVAPIIVDGPASKKIDTARSLAYAQNAVLRKSPLSDIGAYESPASYLVNFNANGGTSVDSQTVVENALLDEPTPPTRDDYTFDGWYRDDGTFADSWSFASDTVNQDMTLYAKWVAIPTYQILYDANGATQGSTPTDLGKYRRNNIAALQDAGTLQKDHAVFVGWCTDPTGNGTILNPGDAYEVEDTVTFYAIWKANTYSVTYDANKATAGTAPIDSMAYEFATTAAIKDSNDLKRDAHTFREWNTKADGSGTTYHAGDNLTVNDNITLYAQWDKTATPVTKPVTKPSKAEVASTPATGDSVNTALLISLLGVSGIAILLLLAKKRRSQQS